jgi:hypothetical protein
MNDLENKLQRFYPSSPSSWQVHCLDVTALPLCVRIVCTSDIFYI